jgi:hypothetical protein
VTPCRHVGGRQHLGETYCLHLRVVTTQNKNIVTITAVRTSEFTLKGECRRLPGAPDALWNHVTIITTCLCCNQRGILVRSAWRQVSWPLMMVRLPCSPLRRSIQLQSLGLRVRLPARCMDLKLPSSCRRNVAALQQSNFVFLKPLLFKNCLPFMSVC